MRGPGPSSTAGPKPPAPRTSPARAGRLMIPTAIVADGRCAAAPDAAPACALCCRSRTKQTRTDQVPFLILFPEFVRPVSVGIPVDRVPLPRLVLSRSVRQVDDPGIYRRTPPRFRLESSASPGPPQEQRQRIAGAGPRWPEPRPHAPQTPTLPPPAPRRRRTLHLQLPEIPVHVNSNAPFPFP